MAAPVSPAVAFPFSMPVIAAGVVVQSTHPRKEPLPLSSQRTSLSRNPGLVPGVSCIMRPMAKSYDIAEFTTRDGIDPFVARKLNQNFLRVWNEAVREKTEQSIADAVFDKIAVKLYDAVMPIGTIIVVDDPANVPPFGEWSICSDLVGKYIKGGDSVSSGGRTSFKLTADNLPSHTHKYDKASAAANPKKFKEDATGATAISQLSYTSTDTTAAGQQDPTAISLDPAYRTVIFMKRTA